VQFPKALSTYRRIILLCGKRPFHCVDGEWDQAFVQVKIGKVTAVWLTYLADARAKAGTGSKQSINQSNQAYFLQKPLCQGRIHPCGLQTA